MRCGRNSMSIDYIEVKTWHQGFTSEEKKVIKLKIWRKCISSFDNAFWASILRRMRDVMCIGRLVYAEPCRSALKKKHLGIQCRWRGASPPRGSFLAPGGLGATWRTPKAYAAALYVQKVKNEIWLKRHRNDLDFTEVENSKKFSHKIEKIEKFEFFQIFIIFLNNSAEKTLVFKIFSNRSDS